MALSPAFSIGISADPSTIVINDVSTGSDGAVVGRKINLYDVSNNLYGASPYDWPNFPSSSTITINPLLKDKALNIIVTWVNNAGAVLYTSSLIYVFVGYAEQFYYSLTQEQQGKPDIINDQTYFENKSKLRTLIDSAQQAISVGQDIYSAQNCIELYTPMLQNPNLYF